jgi:hypothetical protein
MNEQHDAKAVKGEDTDPSNEMRETAAPHQMCPKGMPTTKFECVPMQAALDSSVHCIRCGKYLGEAH